MALFVQAGLLPACGHPADSSAPSSCPICQRRLRLSRERFAGLREAALARDGERCLVCGAIDDLVCHHRKNVQQLRWLATLCRGDHTRLHRTLRPKFGFPRELRRLWREQHPDVAEQLELRLVAMESPETGSLWQVSLFDCESGNATCGFFPRTPFFPSKP